MPETTLVGTPLSSPVLDILTGWPRRIGRAIPGARYAEQDTGVRHGPCLPGPIERDDTRWGIARIASPNVIHWSSCTHHGRSSWGYRLECLACGAVSECAVGSSVSAEDAPGYFVAEHRGCER